MKPEKYIIFDGCKFTRDERTGYYLKTTKPRTRLHIYVWEYYNGPVPKGCHIHHKDLDKSNNDISNLVCVTRAEHNRIHGDSSKWSEERLEKAREQMDKAREYANLWHKSEEGREWHKEHYKKSLGEYQSEKIKKKCACCGKEYEVNYNNASTSRFCSNKCKSRYRRISGVDNITKVCIGCGKEYSVNKYHAKTQQYCSKKCADKYGRK